MSLKLKLKMLSKKMKMLGNMHPDYKGLGMYSDVSPYILKSTLLYFMKFFMQEISIIFIDTTKDKITWYNKPLYLTKRKAIICVDNKYCVCLRDNTLINTSMLKDDIKQLLVDYLENFNILDDNISTELGSYVIRCKRRQKDQSLFIALVNYQWPEISNNQSNAAEALRLKLGEHIHNYLLLYNKTAADIASEFDTYVEKTYEKIVYILA